MRAASAVLLLCLTLSASCSVSSAPSADVSNRPINVVATTSIVADLVKAVGGDRVRVQALMGPGVDPHLFKASEGDITRMAGADIVFYSGLHLEGKMSEVFEQMARRGVRAVAVTSGLDQSKLLAASGYQTSHDPHVWFDVGLWKETAPVVQRALSELDPSSAAAYAARTEAHVRELDELDRFVRQQAERVPAAQRVLITAHDAFNYFGRAYAFEVVGLQGVSTATEAGTADVQRLADLIASRKIPAIFVESSVSPRGIEAVQAAVRARGFSVAIGGSLYSDSLGNPGTPEGTYPGTVRFNVRTIVEALLAPTAPAKTLTRADVVAVAESRRAA